MQYSGLKSKLTTMLFAIIVAAHSPDNSFMGFVVERHINTSSVTKKNQAVVYGKVENMWNVCIKLLT